MSNLPTLPLSVRKQEWEFAQALHLKCLGRKLSLVLRCLAWARNPVKLSARLPWFAGKGTLKGVSAATIANAVCSQDGHALCAAIHTAHNYLDPNHNLLTGGFPYLESVVAKIEAIRNSAANAKDMDLCVKLLHEIFNYDQFVEGNRIKVNVKGAICWGSPEKSITDKSARAWCAGEYVISSGVKYCTYCNADTVFAVKVKGGRVRPYASALDHFRPRSKYPYLGLALENLIPTCTRCNSLFKGAKGAGAAAANQVSPFDKDYYGLFSFQIDIGPDNDIDGFIADPKDDTWRVGIVDARTQDEQRVRGMVVDLFHLDEVYNQVFREDVSRIVYLSRRLTMPACESLSRQFPEIFGQKDVRGFMLGCSLQHAAIPAHRFAKLVEDMLRQFGQF